MKTLNFQRKLKSIKKPSFTLLLSAITLTIIIASCAKDSTIDVKLPDDNIKTLPKDNTPIKISNDASGTIQKVPAQDGGGYLLTNYFVDEGAFAQPKSVLKKPNKSYYFKLGTGENKVGASPTDYDLEFTGTGNGYIKVKSGVTLKVVDKAYKDVKKADISAATAFVIENNGFGHDNMVQVSDPATNNIDTSPSDKKGWFNYIFTNHEVVPITNRTLLFTVGTVTYAFEFLSIYENKKPTPIPPSRFPNNFSYLNFRYKAL